MEIVSLKNSPIGRYVRKCKLAGVPNSEICERVRKHVKKLWSRQVESKMSHLYFCTANCLSFYGLYAKKEKAKKIRGINKFCC